jgi:hypothetical protein
MTLESQIAETLSHYSNLTLPLLAEHEDVDASETAVHWILFSRSRFVRNTDGTWRVK